MKNLTNILLFLILCVLSFATVKLASLDESQAIQAEVAKKRLSAIRESEELRALETQEVLDQIKREEDLTNSGGSSGYSSKDKR